MAYSRWSNSRWYTFWAYSESMEYKFPNQSIKDRQVFEICDFPRSYTMTYARIKRDGVFKILMDIKAFYDEQYTAPILTKLDSGEYIYEDTEIGPNSVSFKELYELKAYIERFVKDVDDHFRPHNFFMYEWYYPTRNVIHDSFKKLKERIISSSDKAACL